MERDELSGLLEEWKPPEPSRELDGRVRAAYRTAYARPFWKWMWRSRVSVPVPVLAAALLVVVALALEYRPAPAPPPRTEVVLIQGGFVTRLDAAGFEPLPNGAARIIPAGDIEQ